MDTAILEKAVKLAEKIGYVFIVTTDPSGLPHLAAASRITLTPEMHVAVTEWFCPGTVSNAQANSKVSLVVWDAQRDFGYQLLGQSQEVEDVAVLDGYAPKFEKGEPVPQVERQLVVRVDRILDFKRTPHSDMEE